MGHRPVAVIAVFLAVAGCSDGKSSDELRSAIVTQAVIEDAGETIIETDYSDGSKIEARCPHYVATSITIALPQGRLPAMSITCRRPADERGNAIWLVGGPFGTTGRLDMPAEKMYLLDLGYRLIVPYYAGSGYRKYVVNGAQIHPNLSDGVDEIRALLRLDEFSRRPLIVVGESFGGFVATAAARMSHSPLLLVLINPLLKSPRQRLFAKDGRVNLEVLSPRGLISSSGGNQDAGFLVRLVTYFLGSYADETVEHMLSGSRIGNVILEYGTSDDKIGIEHVRDVRAVLGRKISIFRIVGGGHRYIGTRDLALRFRRLLETRALRRNGTVGA